jgi:SAM-dependent methyltransferase
MHARGGAARGGHGTMTREHYTFGDNDRAAERLALLARVYEPTTRQLLREWRGRGPDLAGAARAIDLGCGPGYTTELVRDELGAGEAWGLDASSAFVERARQRGATRCTFVVHDVTRAPFPVVDADAAYSRHLLAHLSAPTAALTAWASAVRPGGRLLLEETAALDNPDAAFAEYYACVRALQRHYGQDTFVGRQLDALARDTPWTVERFVVARVPLDARPMATLHAMNLQTWSRDSFAASAFDSRRMAWLKEELEAVAAGDRQAPPVASELGQAVLVR